MIEYKVEVDTDGTKHWYLSGKLLTEQEHKKATSKPTCSGKEVTIDGITYVLKEKNAAWYEGCK
jgi:hypothetical protein